MVGFSHCFRREVGGPGAQNRGLFRLHQFSKVALQHFCLAAL
jgi:seryl-tRNA synthetase